MQDSEQADDAFRARLINHFLHQVGDLFLAVVLDLYSLAGMFKQGFYFGHFAQFPDPVS
jgi:hypothetical protein